MRDQARFTCLEMLECRSLLSSAVQAVQFERPNDDSDTPVSISALPDAVTSRLNAQYPSAKMIEASFSNDALPEFDVTLQFRGQQLEVSFSPSGQITGIEELIPMHELPRPVTDWIALHFPQSHLEDATVATDGGVVSYGVLIVTRAGRELDATLWLGSGQSNANQLSTDQRPESSHRLEPQHESLHDSSFWLPPRMDQTQEEEPPATATPLCRMCEAPIRNSADEIDVPTAQESTQSLIHALLVDFSTSVASLAGTLEGFTTSSEPLTWPPRLSGLLTSVVPSDLAPIEREIAQILQSANELVEKAAGGVTHGSWTTRIAATSLLVAGAILLRNPRKAKNRPVLLTKANSSWSWVFGTSSRK